MLPGSTGSPARSISLRASALSPSCCITAAGGPMKTMPLASQISAKSGSSDRKP